MSPRILYQLPAAKIILLGVVRLQHRHPRLSCAVVRSFNIANFMRVRHSDDTESMVFGCDNSGFQTRFHITINDRLKRLTIISMPPWDMPDNRRSPTLMYVTLLNYKLVIGSVDIDLSDGDVRFKTAVPFGSAANIRPIVEAFMRVHVNDGKRFLEEFMAIKDRNVDAEEAMRFAGMSEPRDSGDDDAAARLLLQLLLSQAGRR